VRAELWLRAETPEETELLETLINIHFQTYLQDFLEEEMEKTGLRTEVKLPEIVYINHYGKGKVIKEVRQGYGDLLSEMRGTVET
jgi:hypothetical protein